MDAQYSNLSDHYSSKPRGYYENSRPEMLAFIPVSCKLVLDVGCSSGAFGQLIKENRPECEVWGVEPNAEAARFASMHLDKVVSASFRADMPELESRLFDCIVFNDVLEHLPNPEQVVKDCKQFLTSEGLIVASIPNILHFYQIGEILYHQDWRYREEGILDDTHLRFFTKKSIERMFHSAGFERVKITGINPYVGFRFKIANAMLLGRISDWKYVQFAVQAWKH